MRCHNLLRSGTPIGHQQQRRRYLCMIFGLRRLLVRPGAVRPARMAAARRTTRSTARRSVSTAAMGGAASSPPKVKPGYPTLGFPEDSPGFLGRVEEYKGLSCYVAAKAGEGSAGQAAPRRTRRSTRGSSRQQCGIVLGHDIWGLNFEWAPYIRLWADKLAEAGYVVVVPDLAPGDWWPYDSLNSTNWGELEGWLARRDDDKVMADVDLAVELARSRGARRVAMVGFCWGGAVAQDVGIRGPGHGIDCFVTMHPCFGKIHERSFKVRLPSAYLCGADDGATPPEKRAKVLEAFRQSKVDGPKVLKVYPSVAHWFALVRPDAQHKPAVRQSAQAALEDTLDYLTEAIGGPAFPRAPGAAAGGAGGAAQATKRRRSTST